MMIMDQNLPVVPVAPKIVAYDPFAAAFYAHPCSTPTVCVGARINRIRQDVMQRMIHRRLPFDRPLATTLDNGRNEHVLLPEPKQHLADRLQFRELAKDERDPVLNPPIGIF